MLSRRVLSLVLLAAACTGGGGSGSTAGGKAEPPAKAAKAETPPKGDVKVEVIADPHEEVRTEPPTTAGFGKLDPPDTPASADVPVGGKAELRVKVGETLVETVSNPRNPVDGSSWSSEPKVEGAAIKFLDRVVESPPPDVDGGSFTIHYRFEAVAPGRAKVSFALTSPESKAPLEEVRFTVVVSEG